jgi:hypothetical protein
MRINYAVLGGRTTIGNDEEDVPERGSAVGASARQALQRAPDFKPNWHLRKYGGDGRLASMNDVENDDHGGEDADPRDGLPLLAGGGKRKRHVVRYVIADYPWEWTNCATRSNSYCLRWRSQGQWHGGLRTMTCNA